VLLVALGYWQRHTGKWHLKNGLGLAGILTLLYAAHPMSYLVSGLLLGLLLLSNSYDRGATLLREFGLLALAYLPTLPLMGWYFWHQGTTTSHPAEQYSANLWNWLRLEPIHWVGSAEGTYRWLVTGLLAGALGLALRRQASYRPMLPWAIGTLLLLGAYVALPDAVAGGSVTRPRWGLLSYFTLLSGLAAVPWSPRLRLWGLAASTVVAGILLGFRVQKFQRFRAGLAEYRLCLPYLRPATTLLPISYGDATHLPTQVETGTYIPVLSEAAAYLAVERKLVSYGNYEASIGYFPLVWQPSRNPIVGSAQLPARLAPIVYELAHVPDYVLLLEHQSAPAGSARQAATIASYLNRFSFKLRFRSPSGLVELYERAPRPSQTSSSSLSSY